jgi:hypothetical protein
VKRFSQDFEVGARNPDRYLSDVRLSQPTLVKEWQETPQERRIFVIGAGNDSAEVFELAKSLKSDGFTVFFYKFCRPECPSEGVGAMAGTSGQIMLYRTPSAKRSKFVEVEVTTARFLKGLDKQIFLISTSEFLAASQGSKIAMHVAETPTPTPSSVK